MSYASCSEKGGRMLFVRYMNAIGKNSTGMSLTGQTLPIQLMKLLRICLSRYGREGRKWFSNHLCRDTFMLQSDME